MADVTSTKTLFALKNGATVNVSTSKAYTMAGEDMVQETQLIGTTWEQITMGEISGVPAEMQILNMDATNFVQLAYANDNSQVFEKILAGHAYQGHPVSATIYAKADTASVRIQKVIVEA